MKASHSPYLLTEADFASTHMDYPEDISNVVPGLTIHIGRGAMPPFENNISRSPLTQDAKNLNTVSALKFIYNVLKPNKISNIVALGQPIIDFADYFGGYTQAGFWNQEPNGVKWMSYQTSTKKHFTFISKSAESNQNLYHLQVYNEDMLYYQAHILHRDLEDCTPVRLQEAIDDSAQIVHDMTCQALESNKGLYNHCRNGVGRSGSVLLAELMFAQRANLKLGSEFKLPELAEEKKYFPKLLSQARIQIRSGLLSGWYVDEEKPHLNMPQVYDTLALSDHFVMLHQKSEKNLRSMADRVLLRSTEIKNVLALSYPSKLEQKKSGLVELKVHPLPIFEPSVLQPAQKKSESEELKVADQEKLKQEKALITSYFKPYTSCWYICCVQNSNRPNSIKKAIKSATTLEAIQILLQNEVDLITGATLGSEAEDLRLSGYPRALQASLAKVKELSPPIPLMQSTPKIRWVM